MMIPSLFMPSLQFPTARSNRSAYPVKKAPMKHYLMRSDVKETETMYILDIDLPGFAKEEIKVHLENGYLCVEASKAKETTEESVEKSVEESAEESQTGEKKQPKQYISKERFDGVYKRTFYIGTDIKQDEIKASYKHGVLRLHIPKMSKEDKEKANSIEIV